MSSPRFTIAKLIVLGIMLCLVSCEEHRRLSLRDLRFPDPEKNAILAKRIQAISGFDTAWRSSAPKAIYFSDIMKNNSLTALLDRGSEVIRYDRHGNKIYYRLHSGDFLCDHWTLNTDFIYDSLGFIVFSYGRADDSTMYQFDARKNKLFTIHKIIPSAHSKNAPAIDTAFSYFDTSGKLTMTIRAQYERSIRDTTFYTYSTGGKLSAKTTTYRRPEKGYNDMPMVAETRYYYTPKGLLDSAIETKYFSYSVYNYANRYYYDSDGIVSKSVLDDHFNDAGYPPSRKLFYRYSTY